MTNKFEQEGGEYSQNIQVAGNVSNVNIGITATEARQIAIDTFKANCYELSEIANATLLKRVEEITEKIIKEYYQKAPHQIHKFQDPGVQYSLINVQKEYGKTGDADLKDYLTEAFLQRINSPERSLKQIVLDEAISILPKLTNEQINILTLIVSAIYLNHYDVLDKENFKHLIKHRILDFYSPVEKETFYTHLQYTGCCVLLSEGATYKPLTEIYKMRYTAFFSKGFTDVELDAIFGADKPKLYPIIIRHVFDNSLLQFDALNENVLNSKIEQNGLNDLQQKIIQLNNSKLMDDIEITNFLNGIDARFSQLSRDWSQTELKNIKPTPVGSVIGALNYNKKMSKNVDIGTFL
jgi:hypothetical protein